MRCASSKNITLTPRETAYAYDMSLALSTVPFIAESIIHRPGWNTIRGLWMAVHVSQRPQQSPSGSDSGQLNAAAMILANVVLPTPAEPRSSIVVEGILPLTT